MFERDQISVRGRLCESISTHVLVAKKDEELKNLENLVQNHIFGSIVIARPLLSATMLRKKAYKFVAQKLRISVSNSNLNVIS